MYKIDRVTKPKKHGFDFEQRRTIALRLLEAINNLGNKTFVNTDIGIKPYGKYPYEGHAIHIVLSNTMSLNIVFTEKAIKKVGKRLGITLLKITETEQTLCKTCAHSTFSCFPNVYQCQCKKLIETGEWLSRDKGLKETQGYILADNATCSQFKKRR